MKKYSKKLLSSIIFSGFVLLTFLFFSPLEVQLGNPTEFRININYAILILAFTALITTFVFSFLISFLPIKILKFINLSLFCFGICIYIQSLFLNTEMNILTGENFTVSSTTKLLNLVVWGIIFSSVFILWYFLKKKKHERNYLFVTKFIAIALIIMQFTGFLSMYLNYDNPITDKTTFYYSREGQLNVSKNNNIIYFILDNCDTSIVEATLEVDPHLFDDFNGFTNYTDNVYTHGRSFPAITYLLTGQKYFYDYPWETYINDSIQNSDFLKAIDELDADIRVYTDPRFVGSPSPELINNYKSTFSSGLHDIKIFNYIKQASKISAYRVAPYIIKNLFFYDSETVNILSLKEKNDMAPINNDPAFYEAILNEKVTINENYSSALRFYHMHGPHSGAVLNEYGQYQKGVTPTQALRGNITIVKEYLEQLKSIGVYDNSTIIITADHGNWFGNVERPQTCLLLVKTAGADSSSPLKTLDTPVSHENIFPTIIKTFSNNYTRFGTPLDEITSEDSVSRFHYNTEFNPDNGYETFLKEYRIDGVASDVNNYIFTGNQWKINYSLNSFEP